jgi:1-acyl-sn-glycerol-3-phosphate acyltransferase
MIMVRAVRSAIFLVWFLAVSILLHVMSLPLLFTPRRALRAAMRLWSTLVLFGLKWLAGVSWELRGKENIPRGPALVAAKHYTMWETIAVIRWIDDPAVIIKRELFRLPFYGWYLTAAEMIAVDREGGGRAIRSLARAARRALEQGRQIVIFPEGTRRPVGALPAYKPGVAALYTELGLPCVPVAHNSGVHWQAFWKTPGTIVVEFLPAIPPGLARAAFMERLEDAIETSVARLLAARDSRAHAT